MTTVEKPSAEYDATQYIGSRPLSVRRIAPTHKAQAAAAAADVIASPLSILKFRLRYVDALIEAATRVDDFTQSLPALPTDIGTATIQSKLEARQMHVKFLRAEKEWYEAQIRRLQNG